ncbi:MAG: ABC transporter substrate-binding protein [Acidimicrobiales bacterium]
MLTAFGLVAAACGSSADDSASSDTDTQTTEAPGTDTETTEGGEVEPETPAEPAAEIATDYGVTDDTIKIGLNADLSGPFASLVAEIVEGQKVYWEVVNENGGVVGRQVELVVLDSGYVTDTGIQNYSELAQESEDGVLMISENTGSPITAAIAEDAIDDNMLVIPLSWASLWPDPEVGEAILEKQTTYCIESMNGVAWLKEKVESEGGEAKLAIVGRPGEYGEDGSAGAKIAAEELGIEVVYDGTGAVAGDDRTAIVSELLSSGATIVWTTLTPAETLDIFGQAVTGGMTAYWSGNQPSFNYLLHIGSDFAAEFDQYYYQSGYQVPGTPRVLLNLMS